MEKMTIEMPQVKTCVISQCGYNTGNNCHAKAITVGDTLNPGCDTFFSSSRSVKNIARIAGVGACKVSSCRHNSDFECSAPSIEVGKGNEGVQCLTYTPATNAEAG